MKVKFDSGRVADAKPATGMRGVICTDINGEVFFESQVRAVHSRIIACIIVTFRS